MMTILYQKFDVPIIRNDKPAILAKIVRVVRSPNAAAIGVAILSGFSLHLCDKVTIIIIIKPEN